MDEPTQQPQQAQPPKPAGVSLKTALANLGIPDDAEVPLDKLEDELIKQTKLAKDIGFDRAKLFFKSMINQESGGKETIVSPDSARGLWQVTDTLAKDYNLDNTDPVLNRYMGINYWDKGYQAADKLDPNPLERAAAATAWYHGGPKALEHIYKTGEYPTIRDNKGKGISTSDHVRTVMDNWLAELKATGLDKDLPTGQPAAQVAPADEPYVEKMGNAEGTAESSVLKDLERTTAIPDSPQVRGPQEVDPNKLVPSTKPWEKFKTVWVMPDDQSRIPTGPELDELYKRTMPVNDRWTFDATREIYNQLGSDLTFARHTAEEINSTARTYKGTNGQRMYALPLALRQQALDVMEKVRTEGTEAAKAYALKLADDNDRQQYSDQVIEQQQKTELEARATRRGNFDPLAAAFDALNPLFGWKRALTGVGIELPYASDKMSATIRSSEERISAILDGVDAGLEGLAGTIAGTAVKGIADKLITPFFGSSIADRLSRNDAELMEKYQLTKQESQYLVEQTNKRFKDSGAADYYWTKIQPKTLIPNLAALDWAARKVTGKRILPSFMYGEKIPINPYDIIRETSVGTVQLGMMLPAMEALGPVGGAYYFSLYKSLAEGKPITEAGGDALLNAATMELIGSPLVHNLPGVLRPVTVAGIFGGESTALDYRQRLDAWRSLPLAERSKVPAPQIDWNTMYSGLIAGVLMNGMELFPKGTNKLTHLDIYSRPKLGEYTNSAYRIAMLNIAHDNTDVLPPIPPAIKTQQLAAVEVAERLSQALDPKFSERFPIAINQNSIADAIKFVQEGMIQYNDAIAKNKSDTSPEIYNLLKTSTDSALEGLDKALLTVTSESYTGTMAEMKPLKAQLDDAMDSFHKAILSVNEHLPKADSLTPEQTDALGSKTVAQVIVAHQDTPPVVSTSPESVRTVEQQAAVESAARNHQPTTHALVNITEGRDAEGQPTTNAVFIDNNGDPVHLEVTPEMGQSLRDYKTGIDRIVADGIAKGESHETLEPKILEAMKSGPVTDEAIASLRAEEYLLQLERAFKSTSEEALAEQDAITHPTITEDNKSTSIPEVLDALSETEKKWLSDEATQKAQDREVTSLEAEQDALIKQIFKSTKGMFTRKAQMLEVLDTARDRLATIGSHSAYIKALKEFNVALARTKLFDQKLSKLELDREVARKEGITEAEVKARNEQYLADIEKAKLDLGKAAEVARLKQERTTAYQEGMAKAAETSKAIEELDAKRAEVMEQFTTFIANETAKTLGQFKATKRQMDVEGGFGFNPIDWGITIYEGYKKVRDWKRDNTTSRAMWDFINFKGRTLAAYSEKGIAQVLAATESYAVSGQMLKEFSNKTAVLLKDAKVSLFDYYKSIQQSRLDGIRDDYTKIAAKALSLSPDKLIIAFSRKGSIDWAGQLDQITSTARAKASQFPWADTKDIVRQLQDASENFKNTSDPTSYDAVRTIIRNNFIYAAASVGDVMPRAEYDRIVNNPSVKSADVIYKQLIHDPLRIAFEATDATPTERLGKRGLYFPLIPKEVATGKPTSMARSIMDRAPLESPTSPAARYATGLGEYTTNISDIRKSFYSQIRAGDIAGMITSLESLGIITRVKKDPLTGMYPPPREGYVYKDASPRRTLSTIKEIGDVRVNDTINLPKVKYEVNKAVYEDFSRLIEPDKYPHGDGIIQKAADAMLSFYIAGPLDLIVHSMNVLYAAQAAIGITPVDYFQKPLGVAALAKPFNNLITGIGSIPVVGLPQLLSDALGIPAFARPVTDAFISMLEPRMIYTTFKVLENKIDAKDPAKQAEAFEYLQSLIGMGSLPSHTGSVTWSPASANATGAALYGPLQYKPIRTMLSAMSGKDIPDPTNIIALANNGLKAKAGAELKRLGRTIAGAPFLFGWNGIDVRARMAVAKAIESYAPNMPEYEKFRVLSSLGVYNRYMESSLGQFLKSKHISPFYSAANAGLRRGINAFTITGSDPVKRLIRFSENGAISKSSLYAVSALSNSITTYVTAWALLSHNMTGLWPWEDEKSRIGKVRIPKEKIHEFIANHENDWLGKVTRFTAGAMGINPSLDADFYVTINPLASSVRGLRATGMESFANTVLMDLGTHRDPDDPHWLLNAITDRKLLGLAANRASAQALTNTVLHTAASGWIPHAAMAGAGWLPAITYQVDSTNARNTGLRPLSYENPAKQSMNIDAIAARRSAAMFFSLNSMAAALGGAAEINPEELSGYDNPWSADLFKWMVGLLTRNAVIQQNTQVQGELMRKGLYKMADETKEKKPGSLSPHED